MLYLEDFLELVEHLPNELRDRCTELRMLDLKVQSGLDQINKAVKEYFEQESSLSKEEQERRFQKIKEEYKRVQEQQEEKVVIADAIYIQMEKYGQKLNKEIFHFKYELEADNPGITEVIEKRFCDAERAVIAQRKDRKKRVHEVSQCSNSSAPTTSTAVKMETGPSPGRATQKAGGLSSASAVDFGHVEHMPSPVPSRSNLTFNDGEIVVAASPNNRGSRASLSSMDRNPDLPPLKKRSTATNKLVAISNISTSPTISTPPAAFPAAPLAPVQSPAATPKISLQSVSSGGGSSSNLATTITPSSSMLTFAGQESRHGRPRKLTSRVQEMLKDNIQRQERRAPVHQEQGEASEGEESDGDQRMYCWCRQKSFGSMVGCDNTGCPYEWFHYDCVKLTQPPKGKWYCPYCTENIKSRRSVSVEHTNT